MIPAAFDHLARRKQLLERESLNGIDWIELVPAVSEPHLRVHFLLPLPAEAYGLTEPPFPMRIEGGVRIRSVRITRVERVSARTLLLQLDRSGDLSRYTLQIESPALDPVFATHAFTFRPGGNLRGPCEFSPAGDCRPEEGAQPQAPSEASPSPTPAVLPAPLIDYRAKEYQAFKTALTDFVKGRVPDWDDNPADLGTTLLELMAYAADHLSYYQDAVMNEAWLTTARQRESVRRHALLIDYRMHDGCAARSFVQVAIGPKPSPDGTPALPRPEREPVTGEIPAGTEVQTAPGALEGETTFAVLARTRLHEDLNQMQLYDWGSRSSALPVGTTQFDLVGELPLSPGDYLLLEEVTSPLSGLRSEADPTARQVVRVERTQPVIDPLMDQPLTRVWINEADALQHTFVLTAESDDQRLLAGITVVRGNLAPVEHGQAFTETFQASAGRLPLSQGPTTVQAPYDLAGAAARFLQPDPRAAMPRVSVVVTPTGGQGRSWRPAHDLLSAAPFTESFVAEIAGDGRAVLRFGDGYQGRRPAPGSLVTATYWIGTGTIGNLGADALVTLGPNPERPVGAQDDGWPFAALQVRNPVPAVGGTDPESMESAKLLAPASIHERQFRAVTEADWAAAAESHPGVARATALYRWTGSWYTAQVIVDPKSRNGLTPALRESITAYLAERQLSGSDVEIAEPAYVPLEIALTVETLPGHHQVDVRAAVLRQLSNQPGGFFDPDGFTFGQNVLLSHLYAAVEAVPGVKSVVVTRFNRYAPGGAASGLSTGVIPIGAREIARCDNDPNYPENGLLHLTVRGDL